jgi:hypothetical protein
MKTAIRLTVLLSALSLNSWAQDIDFDKRNLHIFCTAHLTLMSESPDVEGEQQDALAFLADRHRDEAGQMGATQKHFDDVSDYLKNTRQGNQQKWNQLSYRSKEVCLPGA